MPQKKVTIRVHRKRTEYSKNKMIRASQADWFFDTVDDARKMKVPELPDHQFYYHKTLSQLGVACLPIWTLTEYSTGMSVAMETHVRLLKPTLMAKLTSQAGRLDGENDLELFNKMVEQQIAKYGRANQ